MHLKKLNMILKLARINFFKINIFQFIQIVFFVSCIIISSSRSAEAAIMKTYFDDRIKQKRATFVIIANEDQRKDRQFRSYSNIIAKKLASTHLKFRNLSNDDESNLRRATFGLLLNYAISDPEPKTAEEIIYDEYPDPYNPEKTIKEAVGMQLRHYTDYTKVLDITIFSMENVEPGKMPEDVVYNRSITITNENGLNVQCMIKGAFSVVIGAGVPKLLPLYSKHIN
jgi:hypothetical protein